jgi:hypothetical protein
MAPPPETKIYPECHDDGNKDAVSVSYHVFTALRMLAVEDYEEGRISAAHLADLLEFEPGGVIQTARVCTAVRCVYTALMYER